MGFDVMDELYLPNQFMVLRGVSLSLDGGIHPRVAHWLGAVQGRVGGDPFAVLRAPVLASLADWADAAAGRVVPSRAVSAAH
jgi:hypothetical protein